MKLNKEWFGLSIVVFLPKILGLLISIYLYRAYTAEDIGVYASTITISLWFCYLLESGASDFFLSKKTKANDNYDLFYLSRLFLFLVILLSVGVYSVFFDTSSIGLLIMIYALSGLIKGLSAHYYRLNDSYSKFSKFEVPRLLFTNITKILILMNDISIEMFIYVAFCVELISMLFHWKIIRFCTALKIRGQKEKLLCFFTANKVSYFSYMAIFFSYIIYFESDKLVVLSFLDATELGYYNLAYLMINIGLMPASIFWARYLIIAKNNLANGNKKDNNGIVFIGLGLLFSVLSFLLLPIIYATMYPDKYKYISDLIMIFSFYFVFRHFNVVHEAHLVVKSAEKVIIKCRTIGCIINFSLNALFIKEYGIVWAAATTVLTEFLMSISYLHFNRKGVLVENKIFDS